MNLLISLAKVKLYIRARKAGKKGMKIMYKTMEQIEKEYDGNWVFMINCMENKYGTLLGGEVTLSGKNQSELYRKLMNAGKSKSLTFVGYVGKTPEGIAFL